MNKNIYHNNEKSSYIDYYISLERLFQELFKIVIIFVLQRSAREL